MNYSVFLYSPSVPGTWQEYMVVARNSHLGKDEKRFTLIGQRSASEQIAATAVCEGLGLSKY